MLGETLLGWEHAGAVELDDWRRGLLAVRFPGLPLLADVRSVPEHVADFGRVDVLTAGFPCQPFSVAGARKGQDDGRNGWPWTMDAIRAVNPPEVFLENVPGLLQRSSRGYFGRILADLLGAGYGVRWGVLSAADVGAHHLRERLWVRCLRDWQPTPTGELFGRIEGGRCVSVNGGLFGAQDVEAFPSFGSAWGGQAWGGQAWGGQAWGVDAVRYPTPCVMDGEMQGAHKQLHVSGGRVTTVSSNGKTGTSRLADWAAKLHAATSVCGNYNRAGSSQTSGDGLATQAKMHATPCVQDCEQADGPNAAHLTLYRSAKMHATPKASASGPDYARAGRDGSGGDDLTTEIARHATPRSADFRSPLVSDEVFGKNARPLCEEAGKATNATAGLSLSPTWLCAYQGFPIGWTDPRVTITADDLAAWPEFTRNLWTTTRDSFTDWPWPPLAPTVKGLTRKRVSALGDAQVPQCMAEAYRRLAR